MEWIVIIAILLLVILFFYYLFNRSPKGKSRSNSFDSELIKKLLEESLAVMVSEKRKSLVWVSIANDINKFIVSNFIKAVKKIVAAKMGRLSTSEINITHISVNNEGNTKLQLNVDVVVVINVETNKKTGEFILVFKYFKRSAGILQEITIADPTKIPLTGTTKQDLDSINFFEKLIEGFPGFKDAVVKGKRIISHYR